MSATYYNHTRRQALLKLANLHHLTVPYQSWKTATRSSI